MHKNDLLIKVNISSFIKNIYFIIKIGECMRGIIKKIERIQYK